MNVRLDCYLMRDNTEPPDASTVARGWRALSAAGPGQFPSGGGAAAVAEEVEGVPRAVIVHHRQVHVPHDL